MSGERVLIVEDNVGGEARPLERLLKKNGYKVVGIAKTKGDAVALAKKHVPAIILMDIMLQGDPEGGVDAAIEIKRSIDTKIIYITGADTVTETDLIKKVSWTDPFGFITKPCTDEQVLSVLSLYRAKHGGQKLVFICYAHADEEMKNELSGFLSVLKDVGVASWDDHAIPSGANWRDEIARAVRSADAAILLVSIDFMNSQFIRDFELPELLRRASSNKSVRLLPVYVRFVPRAALDQRGLTQFQGINEPDDPVSTWDVVRRERDAWKKICDIL